MATKIACILRSRVNFTMVKEKLKEQIDTVISVSVSVCVYLIHWIKVNIYGKTVTGISQTNIAKQN